MANINFMARYGERLLTNGYCILPIAPGTKKPGRFVRGKWSDYHPHRCRTHWPLCTAAGT